MISLAAMGLEVVRWEEGRMAYLDNAVHSREIVDILPGSALEKKPREVHGALPAFESAFVNILYDIGVAEAG